ncbi:FMN reductase [Saccharothrix sp. NRRL B-16348]|uniref:bifunctional NAD(P)H-dependent oxidoreductase/GNAT family N-acetyltransferase n=1 Tax=Saccharothrix sp. NRRL B-16348 TaxID=1415542 RepID=UPI0006B04EA7|nr:bifunctional NAD(P)H-dependent oxidoreductase/GNAT family N-acetyltransferase [Saccharothrix sp. NRRL B-16348]KOX32579.1 FMN reductase [Saccharothrix sp. NRRL B-16348]
MSKNSAVRVLVIIASTRPGRLGRTVGEWFTRINHHVAVDCAAEIAIADLGQIGLPLLDEPEHPSSGNYHHEHTRAWSRLVADADAFVIVTPEYNHGMPAALKNAMDYLHEEWAYKPVSFVGYGNTSAGTRGVHMAKQVATTLRMMPTGATVALRIGDHVSDGLLLDDPSRDAAAHNTLRELVRLARVLRPLYRPDGEADAEAGPQPPLPGVTLRPGDAADAAELVVLQRCCWVPEAIANEDWDLPALHETGDDVRAWAESWKVWCAHLDGRLVGAVRARLDGDAWDIGRLMVAPDLAGRGLGTWLLRFAEEQAPAEVRSFRLHTGARSHRNLALYERSGYRRGAAHDGVVTLTKPVLATAAR